MDKKYSYFFGGRFVFTLVFTTVLGVSEILGQESTSIRFYAHPGFDYFTNPSQNSSSPYFRGGPLVLFITSKINDKVSLAGELNLHYMATTGAEMELERMYIKYDYRNYLNFSVGRMYSPIGFWNVNYNFGLILQPNISRPRILNPTHDGGFIQTRDIGLQLGGDNIGKAGFFYRVFFSNGIGRNGGLLGIPYKLGTQLSYTVQLGIEPVEGLRISASGVLNDLPVGSLTQFDSPVPEAMKITLLTASISHMSIDKKFEFIAEGYANTHDYSVQPDKTLNGAIVYMGYKVNSKVVPYLFAEFLDFPTNDAYFPAINPYTNQSYSSSSEYNLGLRYRVNGNLVLKGELAALNQNQFGWSSGIKTQVAFGF
jgi:hypothetical protein